MSRETTLLQYRTWARQLSDTEGDSNVTNTELDALANRHLCEVYDRLVDAGPPDYYAATATFATVAGQYAYGLPADFRSLVNVYYRASNGELLEIPEMPHRARGAYRAPASAVNIEVEYIPIPPTLVDDGDTFDGVSGFDELITNLMARDIMAKREANPSVVMSNIARLEARISSRARKRNKGSPKRIVDLDDVRTLSPVWRSPSQLACYRLRAGNLELYDWGQGTV